VYPRVGLNVVENINSFHYRELNPGVPTWGQSYC
jgi:hypothetical protein